MPSLSPPLLSLQAPPRARDGPQREGQPHGDNDSVGTQPVSTAPPPPPPAPLLCFALCSRATRATVLQEGRAGLGAACSKGKWLGPLAALCK